MLACLLDWSALSCAGVPTSCSPPLVRGNRLLQVQPVWGILSTSWDFIAQGHPEVVFAWVSIGILVRYHKIECHLYGTVMFWGLCNSSRNCHWFSLWSWQVLMLRVLVTSIRSLTASCWIFLPFCDGRLIDIELELIWNPRNSMCISLKQQEEVAPMTLKYGDLDECILDPFLSSNPFRSGGRCKP